ncbi:hypothetical protein, partial [Archaeoglobus sp.]
QSLLFILVGVPFSFSLIIHFIAFSSSFTPRFVEVGNNFGKRQCDGVRHLFPRQHKETGEIPKLKKLGRQKKIYPKKK